MADQLYVQTQLQLRELLKALDGDSFQKIARMLNGLSPVQIGHLLESSPPPMRHVLWRLLDESYEGEVLQVLPDEIQGQFLRQMDTQKVVEVMEGLGVDDVADLLQQLPGRVIREVLRAMNVQDRQRVESVLSYDENTAGGMMDTDTITVRPRFTLDVVLRYLRRQDQLPDFTDSLIVVNRRDEYLGLLPLSKLLTSDPSITVRELMVTDVEAIDAGMVDSEVANLFEQNGWVSAPVVDDGGGVVGRITIDDVVDVIREDADQTMMSMAGLGEEDTFAPVVRRVPRRAVWLGVNLVTAVVASAVIGLFETTLDKVVVLAVLMPIVASMGGIAGSQTLTLVIRGMTMGQVGRANMRWLLSREMITAAINGCFWALVMAFFVSWWFDDWKIAVIIAVALLLNFLVAAVAGVLLPILLRVLRVDPALAGGVLLTTITDVTGFFVFLGLASWVYL